MFEPGKYLDFNQTDHASLFIEGQPVWSAIGGIARYLDRLIDSVEGGLVQGSIHERALIGDRVYIAQGATVEANAVINGPAWIGSGSTVRSGAYIRPNVIAGNDCILGNSCEFKNCLLFNNCEVPHFNYVGDSILGFKSHLGAGVICSNVRLDRANVRVCDGEGITIDTDLRKFGAVVGDYTEVGCNTVLSPGSVLGNNCVLYPSTSWQGVLPANSIVKTKQPHQIVERRSPD
jgi:NDP-sugar pyrophosphorylase family protein